MGRISRDNNTAPLDLFTVGWAESAVHSRLIKQTKADLAESSQAVLALPTVLAIPTRPTLRSNCIGSHSQNLRKSDRMQLLARRRGTGLRMFPAAWPAGKRGTYS